MRDLAKGFLLEMRLELVPAGLDNAFTPLSSFSTPGSKSGSSFAVSAISEASVPACIEFRSVRGQQMKSSRHMSVFATGIELDVMNCFALLILQNHAKERAPLPSAKSLQASPFAVSQKLLQKMWLAAERT